MSKEDAKRAVGIKAASFVKNGMIVGLGTGSTANFFIDHLIHRCQNEGLSIQGVASSRRSSQRALSGGIEMIDINKAPRIDLTIDGADEIDPQNRMIKGGGGAHVREKILAAASHEMVVIVDQDKLVAHLGRGKLPVEILYYGSPVTRHKIEKMGFKGSWRMDGEDSLFLTENGNLLFDISFESPIKSPEELHEKILHVPGVVDTGFFFNLAGRVLIGFTDGTVQIRG